MSASFIWLCRAPFGRFFCIPKRNEPNLPDLTVTADREKSSPDDASPRFQKTFQKM